MVEKPWLSSPGLAPEGPAARRNPNSPRNGKRWGSRGRSVPAAFEAFEENGIGQHAGVFVFPLKLVTLINGPNQW